MLLWAKKEVYSTISFEQCLYVILEKAYSIVSGTQNDSRQPLWAPKKYPQKLIKRGFFLQISKWRINKAHLSQIKSYYSLIHWAKGALPRALPPVPPPHPQQKLMSPLFFWMRTGLSQRRWTKSKGK